MDTFRQAVVKSVALSCLLTMDFVPRSKPPPVEDMVKHELPRVLKTVTKRQVLGPIERELADYTFDPASLLQRVTDVVKNFDKATEDVTEHGHKDMVYSALTYTRKPPTATCDRISKMTSDVANVLGVNIPNDFNDRVGEMYDTAHGMLIRV